jgi:DNA-binding NarL/FixJ family response regulator
VAPPHSPRRSHDACSTSWPLSRTSTVRGPCQLAELTARETEVVALVATGMSNAEITEQLVISPATAKTHVSRALSKLAARDRAQLVTLAYEAGLVVPGPAQAAA